MCKNKIDTETKVCRHETMRGIVIIVLAWIVKSKVIVCGWKVELCRPGSGRKHMLDWSLKPCGIPSKHISKTVRVERKLIVDCIGGEKLGKGINPREARTLLVKKTCSKIK